jgi:acetyltransferase-like isoleucine patch superfamily enzyme
MKSFVRILIRRIVIKLGVLIQKYNNEIGKGSLPKFGNNPKNLTIELPRRIINPERIYFGNNVSLGPGSFLIAMTHYPPKMMQDSEAPAFVQKFNSKISIGNRVTSTADLQIAAHKEITIEDDVMFASNINITDGLHGYENASKPYKYQNMFKIAPITIKRGCWIGQNVVILPGVTIGELAIGGANSLVTENIPDRCIAVGSPAKIIKKWDKKKREWTLE